MKKTMTMKNDVWYDRHEFKEDSFEPNNNVSNTPYSLLDRQNI